MRKNAPTNNQAEEGSGTGVIRDCGKDDGADYER